MTPGMGAVRPAAPSSDVTTIGEAILRLSVPGGLALEEADSLGLSLGGAELNVVTHLSRNGFSGLWGGLLPASMIGSYAATKMRAAGVRTDAVRFTDRARMATYYFEEGRGRKASTVVYDRSGSLGATLTPGDIVWDQLLDTRILYLTGITPALSASARDTVREAIVRARAAGVLVAFDVNYRHKLWSTAEAREVLGELVTSVDLLLCSARDARSVFDIEAEDPEAIARSLRAISGAPQIVVTLSSAGACVLDGDNFELLTGQEVSVLDGIGAGDALAAGAVMSLLRKGPLSEGVAAGITMAEQVLQRFGDAPFLGSRHLDGPAHTLYRISR